MRFNFKGSFKAFALLLGFLAVGGAVMVGIAFAVFSSPEARAQMELDDLPEPGKGDKVLYAIHQGLTRADDALPYCKDIGDDLVACKYTKAEIAQAQAAIIENPAYDGIPRPIRGRGVGDWLRVDFLTINGQSFVYCNTMAEAITLRGCLKRGKAGQPA